TPRNRLLAALPPDSLARLWPKLERVEMPLRQVLHDVEVPIEHVYFPESGWCSMLSYTEDGDAMEVGLIGTEGVVGLPVVLADEFDDLEAIVQAPGDAFRLDAGALREAMDEDRDLRHLLLRYALVHHGQVARTGACNGRHHIEDRLARWLLMAHDRAEGDEFPMTHEFMSMMLGVRRAGVTVAARVLQKAQFIRYERGRLEVTDRPGLESASCECYGIQRRASDRLFGGNKVPYRR
ncbi:Crp/Fnr family transcriptional regulator, partial [Teichococcus aestuarii]